MRAGSSSSDTHIALRQQAWRRLWDVLLRPLDEDEQDAAPTDAEAILRETQKATDGWYPSVAKEESTRANRNELSAPLYATRRGKRGG